MDYLERHELRARRGTGGQRIVEAHGFAGARYTHEMSRAGDPHLHTHVVVGNAVRGRDGRYSAPDMRPIFHAAKTAGTLAEAVLRHELTQSLGVAWGPTRNGTAEIAGIPAAVLDHFSARHAEIAALAAVRGATSLQAVGAAQRETRDRKPVIARDSAVADWQARAAEQGFGRAELALALDRAASERALNPSALDALEARLAGPEGLTQRVSTFTRRDALRAYAEAHAHGAPLARLEELADGSWPAGLCSWSPPCLSAGGARSTPPRSCWAPSGACSTWPGSAASGCRCPRSRWRGPRRPPAPGRRPAGGGAPPGRRRRPRAPAGGPRRAGQDRRPARRWPTPTSAPATRCGVRPGRARRRRTFTARPASRPKPRRGSCTAWPATPWPCPQTPCSSWTRRPQCPPGPWPSSLEHVAARHGRLILVGDRAQLPAIDAGGAFAALADRLGAASLSENRRQQGPAAARGGRRPGRWSPPRGPGPADRPRRPTRLRLPRGRPRPVDRGLGAGGARRSRGRPHPGPRPGRRACAQRHGPRGARRGRAARRRAPGGARPRVGGWGSAGLPAQRLPAGLDVRTAPGGRWSPWTPKPAHSPCGPTTAGSSSSRPTTWSTPSTATP